VFGLVANICLDDTTGDKVLSFVDSDRSITITQDDDTPGNNTITIHENGETTTKVIEKDNPEEFSNYISGLAKR
jgi:hypothetical protein